ncbi:Protein of unknown function [Mycolicibacterium rutilum]|uniref:Uncharacterized protein n=1 Tax=Mycolicibacterium rutilum TaxID=370526 RepID=A0A1H6LTP4_MYCRU|nr:DUF742 domain-containing protein [Mycolicibacterium rutilum]SEH92093.1 Protein of unknown function [Mycolicibacterium rutilum]
MDEPVGGDGAAGHPLWEQDAGDQPSLVRPYILTSGRTTSRVDLPLEAPIETLEAAEPQWPGGDVRGQIVAMCVEHPSVAEIAAKLSLPLGVARVLIGDLVLQGYVAVRGTLTESSTLDERRELIGRTLRGLRAL